MRLWWLLETLPDLRELLHSHQNKAPPTASKYIQLHEGKEPGQDQGDRTSIASSGSVCSRYIAVLWCHKVQVGAHQHFKWIKAEKEYEQVNFDQNFFNL